MAFDEVRFPVDIAYGSSGGPEYATDIVTTAGGFEQRNIAWGSARARYNVAQGIKSRAQLEALIAFFRARKGRARGFRFKDWADYQAVNQTIGTGNGTITVFPLAKHYASGSQTETRTISKPVLGTVAVYKNSVLQTTGVAVDIQTGIVTFATAPAEGVVIAADFEFDVPVRFDTDYLPARIEDYGVYGIAELPLVEIRL